MTTTSPLIVLMHGEERIMVPRPTTYESMVNVAAEQFPMIPARLILLKTRDLEICQGMLTSISSDSWPYVRDELRLVQVAEASNVRAERSLDTPLRRPKRTPKSGRGEGSSVVPFSRHVPPQSELGIDSDTAEPDINIKVFISSSKKIISLSLPSSCTGDNLLARIQDTEGIPPDQARLLFAGEILDSEQPLRDYNVRNGCTIDLMLRLRGAKPIIYLDAPEGAEVTASVKLSLIPSWRFSAIYPVVPIQEHKGQTLEWSVTTKSDGTLREHTVDLDVAYLFWEAMTTSSGIFSPPPSPRFNGGSQTHFDPAFANVTRDEGVVLSVEKELMSYLDKALTSMGLHVEARTSFITYWLPSFPKHRHVALRFVNQEAYERCAPLEVTPAPDVVTRVYMVFKGVSDEEVEDWNASCDNNLDPSRWCDVVGVNEARARDTSLFRVLEWGGMECF